MKKYTILSILAVLVFSLASCVSTKTTSYSDPDYNGKKFNSICVYADLDDFEMREKLEAKLVKELKDLGVNATKGTEILPPTRVWTEEELKERLISQNIDGFLKVKINKTVIVDKMGRTTNTYSTDGDLALSKDKIKELAKSVNANRTFLSNFQSELIDLKNNKLAWSASSNSESAESFKSSSNVVIGSLVQDITRELKEKGHLK